MALGRFANFNAYHLPHALFIPGLVIAGLKQEAHLGIGNDMVIDIESMVQMEVGDVVFTWILCAYL